jgi:hypothetical protein
MKQLILFTALLFLLSCKRNFDAPLPDEPWEQFLSAAARPLNSQQRGVLQGIYAITAGDPVFGPFAAARWSYVANGADTVYHLSFFCALNATFMVCEGRRLDTSILLNGYWRRMSTTETGYVRLTMNAGAGGAAILLTPGTRPDSLQFSGVFSNGPLGEQPLTLTYRRPLQPQAAGFEILAHRGGGRTSDLLPAAENSLEMLKLAPQLGATGVEIDVQLTKDGVPVLYHDATLNERLIEKNGMVGPIRNYTFAQLEALVRLKRGGRIPRLRDALQTILYQTELRFVWLDTKYEGSLQPMRALQQEFMAAATAAGRTLTIAIGLPDETSFNNFKLLNNFRDIPSISELSVQQTEEIDATVWAPQWTLGLQNEEVARQQLAGRRVFTWTMDIPFNINRYMTEGRFNGILSNFPTVVAYYAYARL